MAEGVVVELEAVEVEQAEHLRLGRAASGRRELEVLAERAPVAEAGERVRQRLALGGREQAGVLAHAESEPDEHEQERQRREVDRRRGDAAEVAVAERDHDAPPPTGRDRDAPLRPGGRAAVRARRRLDARRRARHAERPEHVEHPLAAVPGCNWIVSAIA